MMVMVSTQPRCGSPETRAACCPGSQHQDGSSIHNHHSRRAGATIIGKPASHSMESGSSPALWLAMGGLTMCPGRVLPGHFSWEAGTARIQYCSPPQPTHQLLDSLLDCGCNNCVTCHFKYCEAQEKGQGKVRQG